MQPLDQDVVQFLLKCCATTIIVKAFQVGGDLCCDGIWECGGQVVFNLVFYEILFKK
jgi:hypothetical protein